MEKKAHLLRVGKDSAGSHKVHSSRASFSVPIFKNCLGGPQTPSRPSLLLSWVSSGRPPSLTLVWIRAWNTIENSQIQLGLCWVSALCWVSQGPREQVSQFPFSTIFWRRTPRAQTPPPPIRPSLLLSGVSPDRPPALILSLDPCLERHRNFRPVISAAFVGFLIKKS